MKLLVKLRPKLSSHQLEQSVVDMYWPFSSMNDWENLTLYWRTSMAVSKSNHRWRDPVNRYIKFKSGNANIPEPYSITAAHAAISIVLSICSGKPSCAMIYCSVIPLSLMCWFLPHTFRHCLLYCCNLSYSLFYTGNIYIASSLRHRMSKTGDDDEGVWLYLHYYIFLLSCFIHNRSNQHWNNKWTVQRLPEVPELSSGTLENPF